MSLENTISYSITLMQILLVYSFMSTGLAIGISSKII